MVMECCQELGHGIGIMKVDMNGKVRHRKQVLPVLVPKIGNVCAGKSMSSMVIDCHLHISIADC